MIRTKEQLNNELEESGKKAGKSLIKYVLYWLGGAVLLGKAVTHTANMGKEFGRQEELNKRIDEINLEDSIKAAIKND